MAYEIPYKYKDVILSGGTNRLHLLQRIHRIIDNWKVDGSVWLSGYELTDCVIHNTEATFWSGSVKIMTIYADYPTKKSDVFV